MGHILLGDVAEVISGVTFKSSEASQRALSGYIPILRAGNIKTELDIQHDLMWVPADKVSTNQQLSPGDIVICMSSGSPKVVGKSAQLTNGFYGSVGAFCAIIRAGPQLLDSYLSYWLKSEMFLEWRDKQARGANIQNLRASQIRKIPLQIPDLNEQKRIAAILEKADRLRRLRRYARKLSDTFLQSVFLEMFGDPVRNLKGWPKENLSRLCNPDRGIKAGPFGSSLKKSMYSESGYRIYGQEQVIAGDLSIGDYYIDETLFEDMKSYEVRAGDVLISLVGSFGKTLVVPSDIKPGIINPRLLRVRPDSNVLNSIFLANLLENDFMQAYLMHISHGGTMGILNAGLLRKLEVIVPPIDVQNRYSMIMSEHNHLQSLQSESERQGEHLFQSLLHRAFQGEL